MKKVLFLKKNIFLAVVNIKPKKLCLLIQFFGKVLSAAFANFCGRALNFPGRALALSSSVAGGDLNSVAVQGYSEKFCESF